MVLAAIAEVMLTAVVVLDYRAGDGDGGGGDCREGCDCRSGVVIAVVLNAEEAVIAVLAGDANEAGR